MQLSEEALEAAVDAMLQDDRTPCECRHSTLDKHDVNPPCSTRKRATEQAVKALNAAATHMVADAWLEGYRQGNADAKSQP